MQQDVQNIPKHWTVGHVHPNLTLIGMAPRLPASFTSVLKETGAWCQISSLVLVLSTWRKRRKAGSTAWFQGRRSRWKSRSQKRTNRYVHPFNSRFITFLLFAHVESISTTARQKSSRTSGVLELYLVIPRVGTAAADLRKLQASCPGEEM